jgi:DNA helicase HerA-like ATPase
VIAETQRIAKVDTDIFSQMTHFFLFRINPERYDLSQARTYLKVSEEDFHMPTSKYGFFYRKTRTDYPAQEFSSFRHFFDNAS